MPMYEYYCRTCNEKFTKLRPISAAAEPYECHCGAVAQKVLTAALVVGGRGADFDFEAAEAMPAGGGCACGRGSCGCGAGGMGDLN